MSDVAVENNLLYKKDVKMLSAGPVSKFFSYL
jgi:hypothetical protein